MGSNSSVLAMITYSSLVWVVVWVVGGDGCSIDCGDEILCTDNIYGYYDSVCSGFIACVNKTTPCTGICPYDLPVLSSDGLSCTNCTEAGVCPDCDEGEVWCGVEGVCKANSALCGGKCNSIQRPVLDPIADECYPCPDYNRWCEKEEKCYNPETEPCNGECEMWGTRYCSESQLCVDDDIPCSNTTNSEQLEQLLTTPKPITDKKELCKDKVPTIVKTDGRSYIFSGDVYHEEGAKTAKPVSSGWPGLPGNIDAALSWARINDTYFFKGDQYWRFKERSPYPGYPKKLVNWSGLPSNMKAAREWASNEQFSHFFKSPHYLTITPTGNLSITQQTKYMDTGRWWIGCNHTAHRDVWMPVAVTG